MASELTLDGYEALLSRLDALGAAVRDRVSQDALKAGAKEIKKSIQDSVRVSDLETVHIRDDIRIGRPIRTDTGWKINIGPGKKTAWRAKFLEFGHMKRDGSGRVPAYPFMETGLQQSQQAFMRSVAEVIRREL